MPRTRVCRSRPGAATLAGAAALTATAFGLSGSALAGAADLLAVESDAECYATTVSLTAVADAWIDEDSPFAGKGTDSILNVDAGSLNADTAVTSGRARALVSFRLPTAVPPGCILESARLYLFSIEEDVGTRVEAVRLASGWAESAVSWSNQPETVGAAVGTWSRGGYMRWNVTAQVEAIFEGGGDHGFLLRDAAEASERGGGHGFYSREQGESPPQLTIRFAPPGSEEPDAPSPPLPTTVRCGEVLTESTLVTNDLAGCPGDGLVIGAPRLVVDLGGHTIDGVGLGAGIRNDGHASVVLRNGVVQEFDYGVTLLPETAVNVVEELTLLRNEVAAIELFDVRGAEIRLNTLDENGGGISLVSGTTGAVVADNTITDNGKGALLVRDSSGNRLERNRVTGGGDLGIELQVATGNALADNVVTGASDGGIELHAGSHRNRLEHNVVTGSGDHGILVAESDGNVLISNVAHEMSDSGITLESADESVVRGNDVRFNSGGLQLDGSSRNLLEGNVASDTKGIGIELGGGSLANTLVRNTAAANGAQGIYVADEALLEPGNVLERNDAAGNRSDGIVVAKPGHTLTANVARDNSGWGISAAAGNVDGGLNVATGNGKPEQCTGVVCRAAWVQLESVITSGPADPTNSTSATFAFTGSDATDPQSLLVFECSLDGAPFASCASPHTYGGLSAGRHTFATRAVDASGNVETDPATYGWTVDTTPPDAIIEARPADPTAHHDARFEFSAGEPGSKYECALDEAAFSPCTSPADYVALVEGTHRFRVLAIDPAGNVDPEPASYVWTVDASAPETLLGDTPSATTPATSATFTFSSEPGAAFECTLDDGAFVGCASPATYTGLAPGEHRFQVRARDLAGNVDASPASHEWLIEAPAPDPPADTAPPETEIVAGPADPTNETAAELSFTGSDGESDAALRFECRLDGLVDASWEPCASPHRSPGPLEPGRHTFEARAVDAAGNVDASPAAYSWTIDTSAPDTEIGDRPPTATTSTSATFSFSSSEAGSTFECALDTEAFTACGSPTVFSGLAVGAHLLEVRATDAAGNTDASPAAYGWTITAAAPACPAATTLVANADAWVDQNSPSNNKGSDSMLKVQSKGPGDNFRALVRFALPPELQACALASATLRLYAASSATGRTLLAIPLAGGWSESAVTWNDQPPTTGAAATTSSGPGYREWNVSSQVQAMYAAAPIEGFLIRDASENDDAEQQFHSREKGENPPQLVLRFAAGGTS